MVRMFYVTLAILAVLSTGSAAAQTGAQLDARHLVATGIVKTVSSSALTLKMKNGEMTFAVEASTRFVGKSLARDLVLREPRISNWVNSGDRVTVTYRPSADDIPAAVQVRVVQRGQK
jgi:hypothetical protein